MSFRSWLRGGSSSSSSSSSATPAPSPSPAPSSPRKAKTSSLSSRSISASTSTSALGTEAASAKKQEISDMQDTMEAMVLILNDDIDGAEARLRKRKGSSAFHQLGLGVSTFMRSILGFEKDIMTEANNRLSECETRAWNDMKKAQKDAAASSGGGGGWLSRQVTNTSTSGSKTEIYPAGSEFTLVHAEAQLMLAVVAVLHESLTEAIRGFYKLRKAFIAMNTLMECEDNYVKRMTDAGRPVTSGGSSIHNSMRHLSIAEDPMLGSFDDAEFADIESSPSSPVSKTPSTASSPKTSRPPSRSQQPSEKTPALVADRSMDEGLNTDLFTTPEDIFVHSGVNMCFGVLLLLISMVPPAFSRLLYIIGFKGDRNRGVRMLWQSTKFANINGGLAGLFLLAYYNGLVAYAEILPTDADVQELAQPGEIVGYPRERCEELLMHMQTLYPESLMWKLEEARLLSSQEKAKEATALLLKAGSGRIRQITALTKFELALNAMCTHDWPLMKTTFLKCIELNDWSHALYFYIVGCAELEMYRDSVQAAEAATDAAAKSKATSEAAKHKKEAELNFRKAPPLAGKKKFMARQMPFDVFVIRRLQRWEERAKTLKLDLADAVGASPSQEMAYLWNGAKRMDRQVLEDGLKLFDWSRCTGGETAVAQFQAAPDETAIADICRVTLLRQLGRYQEAWEILKPVLAYDRLIFKGPTKDDYLPAAAVYEAAVLCWYEACDPKSYPPDPVKANAFRRAKVDESRQYLDRVSNWEAFVLDARIGMKVQTATDTIQWLREKKKWV